jgi:hypothetical protein
MSGSGTIKALSGNFFISLESQMKWKTESLAQILDQTIIHAGQAVLDNAEYLALFDYPGTKSLACELWKHILDLLLEKGNVPLDRYKKELNVILAEGTLAHRIVRAINNDQSPENISRVYRRLSDCLAQNKMFLN